MIKFIWQKLSTTLNFRFCTSIVTTQADGKIIHGRNLDYNFPDYLRNLTVRAEFYRNNTVKKNIFNVNNL